MKLNQNQITGILDKYSLTKTLGCGFSAKVKLGIDEEGNEFAIKIFDMDDKRNSKRQMELIKQEVESTKQLNHKNICKYYDYQENRTLEKLNGKTKNVTYIVQELVDGSELFSYITDTGVFSENMCRHLFK